MSGITQFFLAALAAAFFENIIFTKALGASTMLAVARNRGQLLSFSLCITMMSVICCSLSFLADKFLLQNPNSYLYLPVIYVMMIALVYVLALLVLWKTSKPMFSKYKKIIHASAFNCAILGGLFLAAHRDWGASASFVSYLGFGFGTGVGFSFASYLLSVVYDKLYSENIPEAFRGYPAMLVYIGILAMAFYGLAGYRLGV